MTIKQRLFDQFRRPRGPLGWVVGNVMARRTSNRRRSKWTVELLDIQPGDRVLELGYGPGLGIAAVLDRLRSGSVTGVDHSESMQAMATRRLRRHPSPVVPHLRVGDAAHLPDDIGPFDKIFSCNVWLFWQQPQEVLTRLREHLAPDGTIAVTHLPRQGDATRATTLKAGAAITAQLTAAGYREIRQEILDLEPVPAVCVLARR